MKSKWFLMSVDMDAQELFDFFSSLQFRRGSSMGIDVKARSDTHISSEFIEEVRTVETFETPFGESFSNEVVRFSRFEFYFHFVDIGRYFVEVIDPPRSLKSLFSFLSDSGEKRFFVSSVIVGVIDFINFLDVPRQAHAARIQRVRFRDVKMGRDSVAKIEVVSRDDAYSDVSDVLSVSAENVEKAIFIVSGGEYSGRLEISDSGGFCFPERNQDAVQRVVFEYLKATRGA